MSIGILNTVVQCFTESDEWLAILQVAESRHRSLQNPDIIWQVMHSHTVYYGVNFEDYLTCHKDIQDPRWHPSYTVTRLLRVRLYEILLHECPRHYRWIIVTEWCAESGTSYIDPHNVRCTKIERKRINNHQSPPG